MAGQEERLWEALIAANPAKYEAAVEKLLDLRDLAVRAGQQAEFAARLHALRLRHSGKRTLIARLDKHPL